MRILVMFLVLGGVCFGEGGLRLGLKVGDEGDVLAVERVALSVGKGESVSALLGAGEFVAVFEGELEIEKRSRVYFGFEGEGEVELFVDGESVLKESGELGKAESERLRLSSGKRKLRVVYGSKADGSGRVRLMWRGRDFGREPVPAKLLSFVSDEVLERSLLVREGRGVFVNQGCVRCHEGGAGMPEAGEMGPSLAGVGDRLSVDWMAEWLKDPKAVRKHARMPKVLGEDEVGHVVAYLGSLKEVEKEVEKDGEGKGGEAVVNRRADETSAVPGGGAQLFHGLGCVACHVTEKGQDLGKWGGREVVELFHAGSKYRAGALEKFLMEPGKHHGATRMPDFGLSEKEAGDLAAFLRGLDVGVEKLNEKVVVEEGLRLVKANDCARCHEGVPRNEERLFLPLSKLGEGGGCVEDEGDGPKYGLSEGERVAVKAFLGDMLGRRSLVNFSKAEYAGRQYENLNCAACHEKDGVKAGLGGVHSLSAAMADVELKAVGHGMGVPDLTFVGEKLQTTWMKDLFGGGLGYRTRPWLVQRMPAFKSRAGNLAEGLAAQYGVVDSVSEVEGDVKVGKMLYGAAGGFACAACHAAGDLKATAVFEGAGVNLAYSGERLRAGYYHRWMRDPQRIDPLTIMPKYFVDENATTLTEPLDGDGKKQMDAILEWMRSLEDGEGAGEKGRGDW